MLRIASDLDDTLFNWRESHEKRFNCSLNNLSESVITEQVNSLKNDGIKGCVLKIKKYLKNEEKEEYYKWIKRNTPTKKELQIQRKHEFKYQPKISIVVPLYNTPKKYLLELIKFVKKQTYSNWELCLADGSTTPLS